jgi:hypothetical protein
MLSRVGHQTLRLALYMPGLVARRHNAALKSFGDRLAAGGLAPKAVIAAVMRKLAHFIYGVVVSGQPVTDPVPLTLDPVPRTHRSLSGPKRRSSNGS